MSRFETILAVAHGQGSTVINAIDALTYADGKLYYQRPGVGRVRAACKRVATGVTLPASSNAQDGTWDLFLLIGYGTLCASEAVHRKLKAAQAAAASGWLLGPWGLPQIRESYPAKYAELFGDAPPIVVFGDNPALVLARDYRPTAEEIANDTDPEPDGVIE